MNINETKWVEDNEPSTKENQLLLIDADIMYHRAAYSVEHTWDFGGAEKQVTSDDAEVIALFSNLLHGVCKNLKSNRFTLCWTLDNNFRIDVDGMYKANRVNIRRPSCSSRVKETLIERYPSLSVDGLEADDIMGLLSGDGTIIVSDDKDLCTVPGVHYKPRKPEEGTFHVCDWEADQLWYTQILTGDRTDGYKGIPGVGPKKAAKILDGYVTGRWPRVLQAYLDSGLHEEDAIVTARLARILRPGEYDWKENRPKLWSPDETSE